MLYLGIFQKPKSFSFHASPSFSPPCPPVFCGNLAWLSPSLLAYPATDPYTKKLINVYFTPPLPLPPIFPYGLFTALCLFVSECSLTLTGVRELFLLCWPSSNQCWPLTRESASDVVVSTGLLLGFCLAFLNLINNVKSLYLGQKCSFWYPSSSIFLFCDGFHCCKEVGLYNGNLKSRVPCCHMISFFRKEKKNQGQGF